VLQATTARPRVRMIAAETDILTEGEEQGAPTQAMGFVVVAVLAVGNRAGFRGQQARLGGRSSHTCLVVCLCVCVCVCVC
jgi:hypothetical protein